MCEHAGALRAAEQDLATHRQRHATLTAWLHNPTHDLTARTALAQLLGLPAPADTRSSHMTDTDPIEDLAQTLYDALHDITPYAEPHFSNEHAGLRKAVEAVLEHAAAQTWIQQQLEQTSIRAMDFRNGFHMDIEPARELLAHQVAAARAMLGDAPNYTETKVEYDLKVAESPELYTVVIQRHAPGALTPHEARQKAEARVAELEAEIARLNGPAASR
ncbi:hypothetical protein ABZ694_25035 [Streptomyces albidoflavus]|uniref:hypothetical protein n=1 Tax=Streptomyces albidoflavus TaxID=1886 RepID=UPI0034012BD5